MIKHAEHPVLHIALFTSSPPASLSGHRRWIRHQVWDDNKLNRNIDILSNVLDNGGEAFYNAGIFALVMMYVFTAVNNIRRWRYSERL